MGYIKNVKLVAYLTQAGRKYIASGENTKIKIPYFALSDPDVSYITASKKIFTTQKNNILPKNFITDLSGDRKNCIYSLSAGIEQRYTLEGGDCNTVGSFIGLDGEIGCTYLALTSEYPTVQFIRNINGVNQAVYDFDISNQNILSMLSSGIDIPVQLSITPLGYESVNIYLNKPSSLNNNIYLDGNKNTTNIDFIRKSDGIVYKKLSFNNLSSLKFGGNYTFNISLNQPINAIIGQISNIQFNLTKYAFIAFDRNTNSDPITYNISQKTGEIQDKIKLGVFDTSGNKVNGVSDTTSASLILESNSDISGLTLKQGFNSGTRIDNVDISKDIIINYNNITFTNETEVTVRLILNQNPSYKLGIPNTFKFKIKSRSLVKNSVGLKFKHIFNLNGTINPPLGGLTYEFINDELLEVNIIDYSKLEANDTILSIHPIFNGVSTDYALTQQYTLDISGFKSDVTKFDVSENNGMFSFFITDFPYNLDLNNTLISLNTPLNIINEIKEFEYGVYEYKIMLTNLVDLNLVGSGSVTMKVNYLAPEMEEIGLYIDSEDLTYKLDNVFEYKINNRYNEIEYTLTDYKSLGRREFGVTIRKDGTTPLSEYYFKTVDSNFYSTRDFISEDYRYDSKNNAKYTGGDYTTNYRLPNSITQSTIETIRLDQYNSAARINGHFIQNTQTTPIKIIGDTIDVRFLPTYETNAYQTPFGNKNGIYEYTLELINLKNLDFSFPNKTITIRIKLDVK